MVRAVAVLLLLASAVVASEKFNPREWEVGQVGDFVYGGSKGFVHVEEVLDSKSLLVVVENSRGRKDDRAFILAVPSTKGIADGKRMHPVGKYKVAGTKKIGSRTYFVVEALPSKK